MLRDTLRRVDPEIFSLLEQEDQRQRDKIRLIPSENYTSAAVLEALSSALSNKYSEGYPGKRYYEGQQIIDQVEQICIARAKSLFGSEHANVQPYSGSPANLAVYLAFCKPGDTIMGLGLPAGGHLTHGWNVSISGKYFTSVPYGVRKDTGRVDLDEVAELARKHRPKVLFCGGTAVPRTIDFAGFAQIAKEVGSILVADIAHISGLVAGGAHPTPVGHAEVVTTTTHKTLRGPRGGMILCKDAEFGQQFNKAVFPGIQGGPLMHVIAGKAVALGEALRPEFREYARQVRKNAAALADTLMKDGFRIVSGGTDNHQMLVDLTNKGITGKIAQNVLDEVNITANRNTIPFEPLSPFVTSGLRLGSPALTTRGFKESDMVEVGNIIALVLNSPEDEKVKEEARARVAVLCQKYPLYE